jgi:hypothetical protein
VRLQARGSTDPDGDAISYRWFHYPEAGGSEAPLALTGADSPEVTLVAPHAGEAHIVLELKDGGNPPLFAYRRAVVHVK